MKRAPIEIISTRRGMWRATSEPSCAPITTPDSAPRGRQGDIFWVDFGVSWGSSGLRPSGRGGPGEVGR